MDQFTVERFSQLFAGNTSAYGVTKYTDKIKQTPKGPKREALCSTATGALTAQRYEAHLDGGDGLGIVPIREDGTVSFSVIDVDEYNGGFDSLISLIMDNSLPLTCFRSKSGGLHIYAFFAEPIKAAVAIQFMRECVLLMGLPKDTEIFPKQSRLAEGQAGNWINLPYYNASETVQFMLDPEGNPVALSEALQALAQRRVTPEAFREILSTTPYGDGPPCLQTLHLTGGFEGARNIFLFNAGVYLKAKHGDQFANELRRVNLALPDPIDTGEIEGIIKQHEKKSFGFQCQTEPLCSVCQRKACKTRAYGIASGGVPDFDYGEMKQYLEDPPRYEWSVDAKDMRFKNEEEFLTPRRFRALAVRQLGKLPKNYKQDEWDQIIRTALENMVKVHVDMDVDLSEGGVFRAYVIEYLQDAPEARTISQVAAGYIYITDDAYLFHPVRILEHLTKNLHIRTSSQEIGIRLGDLGATKPVIKDENRRSIRLYSIPRSFCPRKIAMTESTDDANGTGIDWSQHDEDNF